MAGQRGFFGTRSRRPIAVAACGALVLGSLVAVTANAATPPSLTGSNFEIENDANLKVDGSAPNIDWKSVPEIRTEDTPSGSGDNAFGQGSKEDTAVPSVVSGSIPPNKSDLKLFGVYKEGETASGFLHLYWTRVQDPTGTTNMDFELNKGSEGLSSNGVTPIRVAGDLLITYDLSNGGTKATMGKREWTGSEWGPYQQFNDDDAIGTINTSAITAADSDIGALSARTFGEASVRNTAIFGGSSICTTFGWAYLKSRSSDTFSSALKDFIAPVPINLTNCGSITVIKQTDPAQSSAQSKQSFTFGVSPGAGDPAITSFSLTDADATPTAGEAGVTLISDVQAGSYTISETVPTGWVSNPTVVCTGSSTDPVYGTASAQVSVSASGSVVCTFTNTLKPKLTLVKQVTNDSGGTAVATDWDLSAAKGATTITRKTGDENVAASFWKVVVDAGTWDLSESLLPAGYTPSDWVCTGATSSTAASVTVANGQDVTCTITNDDAAFTSGVTTTQSRILRDSASVTMRTGGAASSVTFSLFDSLAACEAYVDDPEGNDALWSTTDTVTEGSGSGTADTYGATHGGYLATSPGTYYWLAEFSGNNYNDPSSSSCGGEITVLNFTDDGTLPEL